MFRKIALFLASLGLVGALVATMAWIVTPPSASAAEIDQVIAEVDTAPSQTGKPTKGQFAEKALAAALINRTSQLSSMSRLDLIDELSAGKTLAEIASAHGTSSDAVIKVVSDKAKARLDQQVQKGNLSQARADLLLGRLQTKATDLMNDASLGQKVAQRQEQLSKLKVMPSLIRNASESTGVPVGDIVSRMRDGETLTQIVSSAGGDITKVIDAATADFRSAAENAVK
jgi:hypothetical protein